MRLILLQEQVRIRRQFVCDHESYNTMYHQCRSLCEDFVARLECCLEMDDSRSAVESKLTELNELLSQCSNERIQRVREAADSVLPSTSADGGSTINESVSELIAKWEALINAVSLARDKTDAALVSRNEFSASVSKLLQQLCNAEEEHDQLSILQSTLAEKMSYAERSKVRFV